MPLTAASRFDPSGYAYLPDRGLWLPGAYSPSGRPEALALRPVIFAGGTQSDPNSVLNSAFAQDTTDVGWIKVDVASLGTARNLLNAGAALTWPLVDPCGQPITSDVPCAVATMIEFDGSRGPGNTTDLWIAAGISDNATPSSGNCVGAGLDFTASTIKTRGCLTGTTAVSSAGDTSTRNSWMAAQYYAGTTATQSIFARVNGSGCSAAGAALKRAEVSGTVTLAASVALYVALYCGRSTTAAGVATAYVRVWHAVTPLTGRANWGT